MSKSLGRLVFGFCWPSRGEDDTEGEEEPEPEVYLKWEEPVEHEIVTQRLMFSGGGERTITFDKRQTFHGGGVSDHRVPDFPIDFNGDEVGRIDSTDVVHVEVEEKDTVHAEKTRGKWVGKDYALTIQDDESKHNVRIANLRVE